MSLYELTAYRTDHYDRSAERTIRLKHDGLGFEGRIEKWITDFLAEFPDGKVIVSEVQSKRRMYRGAKIRKVFEATNSGRKFRT